MHFRYMREVIAVLILIVAVMALYLTFIPPVCEDYLCFESRMAECKPAVFVNEEEEASWRYEILGTAQKTCSIEVTLLSAKNADLGLRDYEGFDMRCYYTLGVTGYPEKNLEACHGPLKEGLQSIVIEKLYKYIVANIGEINDEILI
ncbi:MAG: hypothetical protein ACP5NS_01125 [Candidatus Pacearchaeota archaeon]